MIKHLATLLRSQGLAVLALVLVLTGTGVAAYAAGTVSKNSVVSSSIRNGEVKTVDVRNGAVTSRKLALDSVTGDHVSPDSLTGSDVDESTLSQVPEAATLNGLAPNDLLRSSVYKREVGPLPGTLKGDGTRVLAASCDAGDLLLNGGPANIDAESDLLESFSSPGSIRSWSARIRTNGLPDDFSVVIVCIDQA